MVSSDIGTNASNIYRVRGPYVVRLGSTFTVTFTAPANISPRTFLCVSNSEGVDIIRTQFSRYDGNFLDVSVTATSLGTMTARFDTTAPDIIGVNTIVSINISVI
jgi:hypothetical protein